jgi:hypothetical protein
VIVKFERSGNPERKVRMKMDEITTALLSEQQGAIFRQYVNV